MSRYTLTIIEDEGTEDEYEQKIKLIDEEEVAKLKNTIEILKEKILQQERTISASVENLRPWPKVTHPTNLEEFLKLPIFGIGSRKVAMLCQHCTKSTNINIPIMPRLEVVSYNGDRPMWWNVGDEVWELVLADGQLMRREMQI